MNAHFFWRQIQIFCRSTDLYFYFFCSTLTYIQIMLCAHIIDDVVRKDVTSDLYRFIADNASKGNYSNFCCASANINNHISFRLHDINPDSDCSSHWFMNQIDFFTIDAFARFFYGTHFHFSNSRRDTNHHS